MKKWSRKTDMRAEVLLSERLTVVRCFLAVGVLLGLAGCGSGRNVEEAVGETDNTATGKSMEDDMEIAAKSNEKEPIPSGSGIDGESAEDTQVDFAALKEENPEIFAWLYIPGTGIDLPVLQSMQGDDYYETHNAFGVEDTDGAVYIELANVVDMCDFNTIVHGRTGTEETGPFAELYRFIDPDFFKEHEQFYIYLDGNVLTYEIFAAYERENTSLIREYDFTYYAGCQQFLDDLYGIRDLSMNLREGWEGLTPYQFLVTLTTRREEEDGRQMVVIGALTADAAGTINRVVAE